MIQRLALGKLKEWKESPFRKPLVLRGARQVGKTTLVEEFAKGYGIFLNLNLEKNGDRQLFEDYDDVHELLRAIFVHKKKVIRDALTLLFIDEIQHSRKAVAILRYFYEEANHIHVIAAGSLLETVMDLRKISFPVGRIEYMALRPCSFLEFLDGIDETYDAELIRNQEAGIAHSRIISLFNEYALIGGMPAVIVKYAGGRDLLALKPVYSSLLLSYMDDVEKYTGNETTLKVIRTILEVGWYQAGATITFEKFGGSSYSSKEVSGAFQTIQKAMLLELAFPTSETRLPLMQNFRKHPKLLWLDTGLVNFFSGIQKEVFSAKNIQDVWRGRIAEHIVAQEILTLDDSLLTRRVFWKKDKHGSEAEVDFVYKYDGLAIPVEVKSGHNSKLKSLHQFMDGAPHALAVRVWSNPFSVNEVTTPNGKTFRLINIPFYYVGIMGNVLNRYLS
ncbi:MAG: AAA family ATPase [Mangrovibacterium sp.]|nr:AAA family ATPase [Mangrovibacterium sp.]